MDAFSPGPVPNASPCLVLFVSLVRATFCSFRCYMALVGAGHVM